MDCQFQLMEVILSLIFQQSNLEDNSFLSKLAHEFVQIQFEVDGKVEGERVKIVTKKLKEIQSRETSNTNK